MRDKEGVFVSMVLRSARFAVLIKTLAADNRILKGSIFHSVTSQSIVHPSSRNTKEDQSRQAIHYDTTTTASKCRPPQDDAEETKEDETTGNRINGKS